MFIDIAAFAADCKHEDARADGQFDSQPDEGGRKGVGRAYLLLKLNERCSSDMTLLIEVHSDVFDRAELKQTTPRDVRSSPVERNTKGENYTPA